MPSIQASIEFLARSDKYRDEKPYAILLGEGQELDDSIPETNLDFDAVPQVCIQDMRGRSDLNIDDCGFEYVNCHHSQISTFDNSEDIEMYQVEINDLLMQRFDAVEVITYETKLRQNSNFERKTYDIKDSLVFEGPAKGAHVDVTSGSAREITRRVLSKDQQNMYLKPGFRFRIINTWRPLNAVLEDRPLAVCDSRSVSIDDLEPADRVLPDRVGEVYYVHYSPRQEWYWLEDQKVTEPFIMLMYDTLSSRQAMRCM